MKKKVLLYLVPFFLIFLALGIVLFFFSPYAPLLLVLSLAIQLPVIYFIARSSTGSSYRERADARREQYERDRDAQAWLKQEEKEAASIGYRYWSKAGKSLNQLNQAFLLAQLGRMEEAKSRIDNIQPAKLAKADREQYEKLLQEMEELKSVDETILP